MENIEYPLLYPCSLIGWYNLERNANLLLGFPNENKETYSQQIIDVYNNVYFIVNPETSSLVNLNDCVTFDEVEFPKPF
jgi:hypothetical protein